MNIHAPKITHYQISILCKQFEYLGKEWDFYFFYPEELVLFVRKHGELVVHIDLEKKDFIPFVIQLNYLKRRIDEINTKP